MKNLKLKVKILISLSRCIGRYEYLQYAHCLVLFSHMMRFFQSPLLVFFQPFNNWLDTTKLDLVDIFIVHKIEEITELLQAHEVFKQTLGEADKEFQAIMRLAQEALRLSSEIGINNPENPYTTVNPQVSFHGIKGVNLMQFVRNSAISLI